MIARSAWILLAALLVALAASPGAGRPEPGQAPAVTFTEHVAPIVLNQCANCHRPGEAGPFPLLTYDDVRRRGAFIAAVTASRYMPPWHGQSELGALRDERRLTDDQIRIIQDWVDAGMPEGDPAKMPALPAFTDGWQLGQPDLVVRMPEAFEVPADGPDIFRNFAIPLNLEQDRWIKAIEFRPSSQVSHHALFFSDETGQGVQMDAADPRPGFSGMRFIREAAAGALLRIGLSGLGGLDAGSADSIGISSLDGWAVGGTPHPLPEGVARRLPRDSDLILQMHFHPTGKVEREQATIGFYFADAPPTRTLTVLQLPPLFGALAGINIPAGTERFVIRDSFELPIDVEVLAVSGHAHYLATDMRLTATLPGQEPQDLLRIPDWDFNWQERYYFQEPVRLPRGTVIDAEVAYDNSSGNPNNPNTPPRRVQFGQESTDEMGSLTVEIVPVRESDMPGYRTAVRQHLADAVFNRILNPPGRRGGR